jgi:hypothetical protein
MLDFTADVKPFRTKVIQAGVSLTFAETMTVGVKEYLLSDIEQMFHTHRGNCVVEPVPCVNDGFESEVYDDEVGFEPTIRYTMAEYPIGTPTVGMLNFVGFSAAGYPVFIVAEECLAPDTACPEGFELYGYDQTYFDGDDPECLRTCNGAYVDSCSTTAPICTDHSPTTLASTFAEFLTIEDETGVLLDVTGAIPYLPIYGYNPNTATVEIIYSSANQTVYPG